MKTMAPWIVAAGVSAAVFAFLPRRALVPAFLALCVLAALILAAKGLKALAHGLLFCDIAVGVGALFMPVRTQPRSASPRTQALIEAKQLALANMMYAADYDDFFPSRRWRTTIQPYLKKPEPWFLRQGVAGWAMNHHVVDAKQTDLDKPETVPLLFESDREDPVGTFFELHMPKPTDELDRTILGFADGHAKAFDRATLRTVIFVP